MTQPRSPISAWQALGDTSTTVSGALTPAMPQLAFPTEDAVGFSAPPAAVPYAVRSAADIAPAVPEPSSSATRAASLPGTVGPARPLPSLPPAAAAAAAAAVEALGRLRGEALEGIGELLAAAPQRRRATSVTWWRAPSAAETWSDTFTEYTLDSEDTSVSSTRAGSGAGMTEGSGSRMSRGSRRGFSVVVRGARSPAGGGYRGRSVTRRERQVGGAALRHRHPTHTPSRGPNPRGSLAQLLQAPLDFSMPAPLNGGGARGRAHTGSLGSAGALGGHHLHHHHHLRMSPLAHRIGQLREDPAEAGGL
mmetsp:Transcript_47935/g.137628  ORF Transcript_47935/g.137628 Transcript_47935/m.137628 type:complete len:307 (-) Transcript_47935:82-1002(-)